VIFKSAIIFEVTDPVSPVVITVAIPDTAGKTTIPDALADALTVVTPLDEPLNTTPVPPNIGKVRVLFVKL
jgi:hypothetical protein